VIDSLVRWVQGGRVLKKLPAWKGDHFPEELWPEMAGDEVTGEKRCSMIDYNNPMFKGFFQVRRRGDFPQAAGWRIFRQE
jgi:hypothetical protein